MPRATYADIQYDIKARHRKTVKTCWIAHVKGLNGLPLRKAHSRQSLLRRAHPCPARWRPLIEESMRRLGMLPAGV
jgi:hypothetical protein